VDGWILKGPMRKSGRDWRLHNYVAVFPEKLLKEVQYLNKDGTEKDSAPSQQQGTESLSKGTESLSDSTEPLKYPEPSENNKKSVENEENEALKEVQFNQFNHLKNQGNADQDSGKESYPLLDDYTPTSKDFADLKKDLKRKAKN
jgi:hypothetical protein